MSNIDLHIEEFKDFIGMEVKSASLDIVKEGRTIPIGRRKVRIVNHGTFKGVYENHYAWYAYLESNGKRRRGIELTTFDIEKAREKLEGWAGELDFCTHLLEKHGFEEISLLDFYCIGKSDLEITLKMNEKYESFRKYRIDMARSILNRYE